MGNGAKMMIERSKPGTELVDSLKQEEIFRRVLGRTKDEDFAIACAAVCKLSKVCDMEEFYKQYTNHMKHNSNSREARKNPKEAAKTNILKALDEYGEVLGELVWGSIINGRIDKRFRQ